MRLGSKMRVFRATDYSIDVWMHRWPPAIPLLFELGVAMGQVDSRLAITQFDGKPLAWDLAIVSDLLSKLVETFLEVRGNATHVDCFDVVFDTEIGIDLLAVIRLSPDNTTRMSVVSIRFEMEHVMGENAPLTYDHLFHLFCTLVARARPDYAEVRREPPITDHWHEQTRVNIDTTKVPVTIQWLNYFSREWVERIGEDRINQVFEGEVVKMASGVVFVMQREPFTYEKPEHVTRQQRLHDYFGLPELHKEYRTP